MTEARDTFCGARLRSIRTFAGLSLEELGQRVAASRQFLFQLETGARVPNEEMTGALADALGVETAFFFSQLDDEFRIEEANFRGLKAMPLHVRQRALAHGTLFGMLVSYLDSVLHLPGDGLPKLPDACHEDIERAAEACRLHWGLGVDRPIDSMTRLLENAGVVVTRFRGESAKVDAFSRIGRRNIVVLNTLKDSPSRARFDLAHELGHLVLHGGVDADYRVKEAQADRFASAFLLPRKGFVREFPRVPRIHWKDMIDMKLRWKASIGAIIKRAFDLQLIDGVRYRNACIYLRKMGWHRNEVADAQLDFEEPEIVLLAFETLKTEFGQTPADVARELKWRPATFEQVSGIRIEKQSTPDGNTSGAVHVLDHYRKRKS